VETGPGSCDDDGMHPHAHQRSPRLLVVALAVVALGACTAGGQGSQGTESGTTGDSGPEDDTGDETPAAGEALWDPNGLPEFQLVFAEDNWQDTLWAAIDQDDECADRRYVEAGLRFVNPVDGSTEDMGQIGVRLRGHSGLQEGEYERPGFKLKLHHLTAGQELHDAERINLLGTEGDYSLMREHLALMVSREAGLPAPRNAYALLSVNGEPQGLYPYTEETDDDAYVDAHFDGEGSLYKAAGYCGAEGDFVWLGDEPADYAATYEPKGDTPLEAMETDLIPLIACANSDEVVECLPDHIDLDAWLTATAVDMVLPDVDGMASSGQNFMLHHGDGGFVTYRWDLDQALTVYNASSESIFDVHPTWNANFESLIAEALMTHWREDYCTEVLRVAELVDPDGLFGEAVEDRRAFLAAHIEADPFMDAEHWGWIVDDILDVARERHPAVVAEAQACP
jgi:spore coat protein CotH